MDSIRIAIADVVVNSDRRAAVPESVQKLADSIAEVGLLHPILVDREQTLIAGLHRLEAAKLLGWAEIECTVSELEGLEAEMAEIDENFVRRDLSRTERGDLLLRRKEIYEQMHPETKATKDGGPFRGNQHKNVVSAPGAVTGEQTFVKDSSEKLGVSERVIWEELQLAQRLTPEVKDIIDSAGNKITKKAALKLSRLEPEQQLEAAESLASGEIASIAEYLRKQKEEDGEALLDAETISDSEGSEISVPFQSSDNTPYSSFKESVAELKNPDLDRNCTPDSFLEEITAFVRKFQTEIEWYYNPYYEAVFSRITSRQLHYLRGQINLICGAADKLYDTVERMIRT